MIYYALLSEPPFLGHNVFFFFFSDKRNEGRVKHRYADSLFIGTHGLRNSPVAGPANQPARPT